MPATLYLPATHMPWPAFACLPALPCMAFDSLSFEILRNSVSLSSVPVVEDVW